MNIFIFTRIIFLVSICQVCHWRLLFSAFMVLGIKIRGDHIAKQWEILLSRTAKSLQMVTTAMKLKDGCSLERKLWPNLDSMLESRDWWSWNSNTLATRCEEPSHWERTWCWERLKAGEGDDREWDGWMVSLKRWAWVWVSSRSWWWRGKPAVLQSVGLQSWTWLSEWTELTSLASVTKILK